jgi:aminoglycoside phosphotransferase (APT) family kinase protein
MRTEQQDDSNLTQRCRALLLELQLVDADETLEVTALTGGVASDIARVRTASQQYAVKFALSRLRVAEQWQAPVHRNLAEYRWLRFAGKVVPGCVPKLYGCSEALHGFAMQLVECEDVYQWKSALLDGHPATNDAVKVAHTLGQLHAASTRADFDDTGFQNHQDFLALRAEPYLLFTASRHPAVASRLQALADQQLSCSLALVHGDISPKNILFSHGQAVLLDAECATLGDPVFDVAFCLNHLVLKAFHLSPQRRELLQAVMSFWHAYVMHCTWEASAALEQRLCVLLPALMLARVDGKSPVEYLGTDARDRVRATAISAIHQPAASLDAFVASLADRAETN